MKLADLLQTPCPDLEIKGLCNDSRQVKTGDLFFAYPGALVDGRDYIQQSLENGCSAVIYEPYDKRFLEDIRCIPVKRLASRLSEIASRFYDNPSRMLSVTGVTGTNGKTSIAYLLAQAYERLNQKAAYVGTLGQGDVNHLAPLNNTTPDALCLQKLLAGYRAEGCSQVCMEVSSHALEQGRVDDIFFNQAIYTNLSHEHLDYHGSIANYAQSKSLLFSKKSLEVAIVNGDDEYSEIMVAAVNEPCVVLRYGLNQKHDVRAVNWETTMQGTQVMLDSPWGEFLLQLNLLGQFNVYNALAVFSSLLTADAAHSSLIVELMSQLRASPGRMEMVYQKPCVLVDYAHTPDALLNVLKTASALKPRKLWLVFGCGGDRDRTKRAVMGKVASDYADYVVVTNDNPRTEDPQQIAEEVASGVRGEAIIQLDRREAIEYVLERAEERDIVVVAGKGHEDYQIIGTQRTSFSDQAVIQAFFG